LVSRERDPQRARVVGIAYTARRADAGGQRDARFRFSGIYLGVNHLTAVFRFSRTMVSAGLQLIAVTAIASCYLVAVTDQHPPKWYKPYSWNGPPKHSHLSVYNNKPQPHPYFQQVGQKPSKVDQCQLRKVVFTQDAQSPQVRYYYTRAPPFLAGGRWLSVVESFCFCFFKC